ncbi:unnamed protein product [Chondrus crispus]|uniref:Uncharacterized protein n=1 Tax=Chondrus crispus TaxID=2769 RepID=R7QL46_CHOCR|nr:unnamed protein product [Chondrus crispus]CDF38804.1 unnamed protein product [Chondrus crispus]|eukprot:XP_005718709.1 unnamed protein product [Chondrus crispus]
MLRGYIGKPQAAFYRMCVAAAGLKNFANVGHLVLSSHRRKAGSYMANSQVHHPVSTLFEGSFIGHKDQSHNSHSSMPTSSSCAWQGRFSEVFCDCDVHAQLHS